MPIFRTDYIRACAFCGDGFKPVKKFNSQAKFCSESCRQMAYRERKRGTSKELQIYHLPDLLSSFTKMIAARSYSVLEYSYAFGFCSMEKAHLFITTLEEYHQGKYIATLYEYHKVAADGVMLSVSKELLHENMLHNLLHNYEQKTSKYLLL